MSHYPPKTPSAKARQIAGAKKHWACVAERAHAKRQMIQCTPRNVAVTLAPMKFTNPSDA